MTASRTYLDHNATTPLRPEARAAMLAAMEAFGNPSSVHVEGRRARAMVETAREQVAALVDAKPSEVVFTSGATEANNWVIAGGGWTSILASGIEHDSVRTPLAAHRDRVLDLGVDGDGIADLATIERYVAAADGQPRLVVLQAANNETGVLQDVRAAGLLVRQPGLWLHTDAVQAAGKVKIDFATLGADSMALSAHKLGGPAGVGALVIRDGAALGPVIVGGGQERRRRAGTENVIGIAGFGAAAEAARRGRETVRLVGRMRDDMERRLSAMAPQAVIVGRHAPRLANTTCVALPGCPAEMQVIRLDLAGVAVSAGAACSSGKVGASHVLAAMGLPAQIARSAIRISLGWNSTEADVAHLLGAWAPIVQSRAAA